MKKILLITSLLFSSLQAFAEGPILECEVTREMRKGLGHELVDSKKRSTVIDEKIEETSLKGALVKTYINANGLYMLLLHDKELESSSTSMGTVDNQNINLSLSGKGITNYITCGIK